MEVDCDVLIIGGGINGAGIAADAAMRGLSVVLCEKNYLASATSSASSKLIHGGLRYLEQYEFSLVRKALKERETLLTIAPHLISPLHFVLPYVPSMRPYLLIRMGLFLYDLLAQTSLAKSKGLKRAVDPHYFKPLKPTITKGFSYFDAKTDDARLVIEQALQASLHGATILTHTTFTKTTRFKDHWLSELTSASEKTQQITSKVLINASGPWVNELCDIIGHTPPYEITPIKGSHIIIPKLYSGSHAYTLQNHDKRIIFTIPYLDKFTLVGTTDIRLEGSLNKISPTAEEEEYLCDSVNHYFDSAISRDDIIDSWSGVRPLLAEKSAAAQLLTRDYKLYLDCQQAPIVHVLGGKITTYRCLAEELLDSLQFIFKNMSACQTATTVLPGALEHDLAESLDAFAKNYPHVSRELLNRYLVDYGHNAHKLLFNNGLKGDLGRCFGDNLYQIEVDYLRREEWVKSAEDIVNRRRQLGVSLTQDTAKQLEKYLHLA